MSLDNMGLLVARSLFPMQYNQNVKNRKDQGRKYLSQWLECKHKIKMQLHTQQKPLGMKPLRKLTALLIWYSTYMPFSGIQLYRHVGYYDFGYPPHWPHIFIVYFPAMLVLPECIYSNAAIFLVPLKMPVDWGFGIPSGELYPGNLTYCAWKKSFTSWYGKYPMI